MEMYQNHKQKQIKSNVNKNKVELRNFEVKNKEKRKDKR